MDPRHNRYYIVIGKNPLAGRREGRQSHQQEFFHYECENEEQAWDYARNKARQYGPTARVDICRLAENQS